MTFQVLQGLTSACLSSPIWSLHPCSTSLFPNCSPHLCPVHFLCWKPTSLDVSCGQDLLILVVSAFMSPSSSQSSQVTPSSVGSLTYVLTQSASVSFIVSSWCDSVILLCCWWTHWVFDSVTWLSYVWVGAMSLFTHHPFSSAWWRVWHLVCLYFPYMRLNQQKSKPVAQTVQTDTENEAIGQLNVLTKVTNQSFWYWENRG